MYNIIIVFLVVVLILFTVFVAQGKKIESFGDQKHRLLFIHIPKTGGTSVEDTFKNADIEVGRFDGRLPHLRKQSIPCVPWHVPPKHLDLLFEDHIVFTVIRNPVDRLISEYTYRNRDATITINQFIFKLESMPQYASDCHLLPQTDYLYDRNGQLCPNVLRLEYIQNDMYLFLKKYGIPNMQILHSNKSMPKKPPIAELNKDSKQIIRKFYKADFDLFFLHKWYTPEELEII